MEEERQEQPSAASSSFAPAKIKTLFPASAAGSLFPILQAKHFDAEAPTWLSNASFSESLLPPRPVSVAVAQPSFREGDGSDSNGDDAEPLGEKKDGGKEKKRKKEKDKEDKQRKKHKKKEQSEDTVIGALKGTRSERKASGGIWAGDAGKDWYFDFRGDKDNLAFESLYRHDIARYHLHQSKEVLEERLWRRRLDLVSPEGDSCSQEESVRTNGRYWSSKVASLERRRDFKRLCFGALRSKKTRHEAGALYDNFIALNLNEGEVENQVEIPQEKSWDDYVLDKLRSFNQLTHEKPGDESVWISFAKFQDELIEAEKRKTMVQHAIDKKILLLEKALEHHPNSEELILLYLETCRRKDDLDTLISKWERMIVRHSGSYRLWWEFLRLRRSTFSKFSVSALRKLYSQALQALAAARNRQQKERLIGDDTSKLAEAEVGIIAIFLDLCRFEWQTGHHELAVGLFQAQFEYSFLCPLIQLSQNNKLRLFESFWNSGAPRIGEAGAVGWNTWMEQKEEQIQNAKAMTAHKMEEESSWAGWKETNEVTKTGMEKPAAESSMKQEVDDAEENDEIEEEDDAALLEKLGLNLDLTKDVEVKDSRIWKRWSEEESQRACSQWLPVKQRSRAAGDDQDEDEDEGLENMVLFDDIRENLFTLTTVQGKFYLMGQFLEFCNVPLFQWCCSNALGYKERIDSLEVLTSDILNASTDIQGLGNLVFPKDWIKESKGRARFVRNTVFLLKDILSHNLHFQEVLLSLEALEASENDGNDGSSASRALAKKLLKASRQDLTLWAAYACFEASTGNVDVARKIFDTALTSLSALPKEAQSDASSIYLAYAEVEMAQCGTNTQDYQRVLYILHFLGLGDPYQPNFSTLSGTQVLKARRGYNDQLQKIYTLGRLREAEASLVICAALFQQLTAGWQPATSIFQQILSMPVQDGLQENVHHERLLHCYTTMLESQKNWVKPTLIRQVVKEGAMQYPFNLKLLTSFKQNTLANDTRRFIDKLSQRKQSSLQWIFALSCEVPSAGATSRVRNVFERALDACGSQHSVLLWRLYVAYELAQNNNEGARRVFFRAIHACPWSKALWIDGFQKMSTVLSVKELSDLVDIMRDKELRIRTDVYEILLEEAG
ncbi:protein NRDE2 homolog [Selaginella moellendorffii]|uniref:protein NRDE2 homolog n=1 Tax=Selaginella moellendorffii TaxID=88036 RepID=UPI000D1C9899|nr:protein NRDE2 homolog [Selaginella moellendorffii]|eukprot:XP_024528275.1 protein NRDE2 homolog [Selaginella moellendorffii]